jgi:large subunit ribosomal protein L25
MKSITINGSQRESVGKVATKALRNAGKVPCVVYGGDKPIHFSADTLAFKDLVYTPDVHTVVIKLDNGDKINAVLQDIQFHPVTDNILHVDFYQIFDDKEIYYGNPCKGCG